ncbi:hypothetical protein ACH4YN_18265 [Streptomyces griseofuscus]|uniref:hypothetical protein n=1 Tax=Streptomyces griseofuscus TaxID=146922 RepID=UPI0037AAEC74
MKRRIGEPKVPTGLQYEFFQLMQRHVLNQGDRSLAALSKGSGWSRQTWHKALRGPELPNRDLVKALVEHLFPEQDGVEIRHRMVEEALAAWTAAVDERTFGSRTDRSESVPETSATKPLVTAEAPERRGQPVDRSLDSRDFEENLFRWNPAKERANLPEEIRFFRLLYEYYLSAGQPTVRWVAARMPEESPVTRSTLSDWLNGRSLPSSYERLQKVLEVMRQKQPVSDSELEADVSEQQKIQTALNDAWHARPR